MPEVRILFYSSSKEKVFPDADGVYTKGGLLCVRAGEYLIKYPLCNVFSVVSKHGAHWGSKAHLDGGTE
jgi:hypothetical protein